MFALLLIVCIDCVSDAATRMRPFNPALRLHSHSREKSWIRNQRQAIDTVRLRARKKAINNGNLAIALVCVLFMSILAAHMRGIDFNCTILILLTLVSIKTQYCRQLLLLLLLLQAKTSYEMTASCWRKIQTQKKREGERKDAVTALPCVDGFSDNLRDKT